MSRHDGVSCDSCLKSNFRGKRYKCLVCYDYDLCATCYESGATSTRHTTDHPVQCILTRSDFDLFYGGEATTAEQPQAYSCPYCSKMGFTETLLQEHVTTEHADTSVEVVCPICAALPGGDPNHMTDDFAAHLTLEHRAPKEFDEPTGIRHVRRIPHPGRGVSGARTRRATNMHFSSGASLTGLSPSGREAMDPIAELLSQLSSVRSRAAAAQSVTSQLQQLEMQLQSTRQQLERAPRRQLVETGKVTAAGVMASSDMQGATATGNNNNSSSNSLYLLSRCSESVISGEDSSELESEHRSRSLFVQELLLSTLTDYLTVSDNLLENLEKSETAADSAKSGIQTWESKSCETDMSDSGVPEGVDKSLNATSKTSSSEQTSSVMGAIASGKTMGHKPLEKVGTKQKVVGPATMNGRGASGTVSTNSRGMRQSSITYQSQGERHHSQAVHNVRQGGLLQSSVDLSNNLSLNMGRGGGASYDTENPQPLPGRPGSGGRDRDLHPSTAKRNMVKHYPAPKASDREPPPH